MATTSKKHAHPVRTLFSLALAIAALYGIMAYAKAWAPKLGLDLRGGTSITLTANSDTGTIDRASLELARTIIQQRVDSIGVGESEVAISGDRQIIVSVPNVQKDDLVRMVGTTAQLYFRQVFTYTQVAAPTPTVTASPSTDATAQATTPPTDGTTIAPVPTASATEAAKGPMPMLPTPGPMPRPTAAATPAKTLDELLTYSPSEQDQTDFAAYNCGDPFPDVVDQPLITCDQSGTTKFLLGPALISGKQLTSAVAGVPQNQVSWQINLQFNDSGATDFQKVTTALATQSDPMNAFGIVLDGKVVSYPRVNEAISGGRAEITGSFTQKTATELANVLKYGALPLSFTTSEVNTVSATLGGEQLTAGMIAGLIGLILVVLYSIVYYRGLFIVVVASLIIAAAITYALMVLLGQSMGFALNLPGIAGAIVAIGVTADSFIIYFERIRDEMREGRGLRSAIESGWIRSRTTILIADAVSLLSAVVLFILAIGAVRGFAFTLGLTTIIDLVVVFFFTKPLMTLLGHTKFYGEGRRFSGFEAAHMGVTAKPLVRRRKEA